jgi:hypothetical protein
MFNEVSFADPDLIHELLLSFDTDFLDFVHTGKHDPKILVKIAISAFLIELFSFFLELLGVVGDHIPRIFH